MEFPEGKRYNSFVGYYKRLYGERLQKLVLDAGFTCPNRDGSKGLGGCTFCDNAAFHPSYSTRGKGLLRQLDEGIEFHSVRYKNARHYLAYFQPYSNTYAPLSRLKQLYQEALSHPQVVGVVIGTRPDCVDEEKLDYLQALQEGKILKNWEREQFKKPLVTLEFGVESCHDETLKRINRCHDFACVRKALDMAARRGLSVGAHFILGLPGEDREMLLEECATINALPLLSVKFHQLQFVRGTVIEKEHDERPGDFLNLGMEEHLDLVIDMLERLRPSLLIERVAGEVPPRFVRETRWGQVRNFEVLRLLDKRLEERDSYQGKWLEKANFHPPKG